jgi:ketosteroid isomerase-like protein
MTVEDTRQIVRAYHNAYCLGDARAAGALLGDRFSFSSPMMAFDTPQQHVAALARFVPFMTGCTLISELYGEGEATLAYDLHVSLPPRIQRCAEHFRIRDGRISSIIIIFGATPWHPIIETAAAIRGPLEVPPRDETVPSER